MAVSDALRMTAQGLDTLVRTNIRSDLLALEEIIRDRDVSLVLIGNPLHMSGHEGAGSAFARDFAERLSARTRVPTRLWDERLTTVEAQRVLRQSGASIEKRARAVDRLSAVILLESYLDSLDSGEGEMPADATF
ncbi:MAG: Holliday junction resolvase RuvX [Bryobacteraceae bacterium]|nr:Holliday junction resolvase RuvX [Bryobacteraceae bacterium]